MGLSRTTKELQSFLRLGLRKVEKNGVIVWPVTLTQAETLEPLAKPVVEIVKPKMAVVVENQAKTVITPKKVKIEVSLDWEHILGQLANECQTVCIARGNQVAEIPWFTKYGKNKQKVLDSLTGMKVVSLISFKSRIEEMEDQDALIFAGRLLVRLLPTGMQLFARPRGWFSKTNEDGIWYHGLSLLANAKTGFGGSFTDVLSALDSYINFARQNKLPAEKVTELIKPDQKIGFDLIPLSVINDFAKQNQTDLETMLNLLWQKEQDHAVAFKGIPSLLIEKLVRHIPKIRVTQIPKQGEQKPLAKLLEKMFGKCQKLPTRLKFGLSFSYGFATDTSNVIGVTETGTELRLDPKGKLQTEGYMFPDHPTLKGWGKGVTIWVDDSNADYLGKFWHKFPPLCPWEWYEKWGEGQYLQSGKAKHPDPKFRPDTKWLEQTGISIADWAKQNGIVD